jgi:hypothetical protein
VTYGVGSDTFGKGLELLREAVPRIRRIAVLSNPDSPSQSLMITSVKTAGRSLGLQLHLVDARGPAQFDGRAAHHVRAGDQPPNRQGPRAHHPAGGARAGGRAHPVSEGTDTRRAVPSFAAGIGSFATEGASVPEQRPRPDPARSASVGDDPTEVLVIGLDAAGAAAWMLASDDCTFMFEPCGPEGRSSRDAFLERNPVPVQRAVVLQETAPGSPGDEDRETSLGPPRFSCPWTPR